MQNLLFIMTPGVNLSVWKENGSLSREIKPYLEYAKCGFTVRILTFGLEKYDFPNLDRNIEFIQVPLGVLRAHFLPFTHRSHFKWADVIKTNQSYLSWIFVAAAKLFNKPILLRCGYVHGEYLETTSAPLFRTRVYQFFEALAFRFANRAQVPTGDLAKWITARYRVDSQRVSIVPNFVDTDVFKPAPDEEKEENSVISVGRLHPVKRFDLLIRACALIPGCKLTIIGEGPERSLLSALAKDLGVVLNLPGNLPNEMVPVILRRHKAFAITSVREGHPKSLIEAMSCGLPCVAVSAPGIDNIVQDGANAVLSEGSAAQLAKSLGVVLFNSDSAEKIGAGARKFVVENYSFDEVFLPEFTNISHLMVSA